MDYSSRIHIFASQGFSVPFSLFIGGKVDRKTLTSEDAKFRDIRKIWLGSRNITQEILSDLVMLLPCGLTLILATDHFILKQTMVCK